MSPPGRPPDLRFIKTRQRTLRVMRGTATVWLLRCLAGAALAPPAAHAALPAASPAPASLCQAAIRGAEAHHAIPDSFLSAIGRVESGRPDSLTGAVEPWPWTVNAEGSGSFYASKAEAIDAVRALQARHVRSIDVGCLQVNLAQHPDAFASLEQAFDPASNAAFAAGFLVSLHAQTGSWPRAAAAYHSQTPGLGTPYQQRVLAEWAVPDGAPATHTAPHSLMPPTPAPQIVAAMQPSAAFGRAGAAVAPGGARKAVMGRDLAAYRAAPIHRK